MTPARLRLIGLLSPLVAAALALLAWSQTWVRVVLDDGRDVAALGEAAAPAIPPFALAALALVGALAIAGVFFRVVLGALQSLLGLGIVVSGGLALSDPVAAAASVLTETTGLAGAESVRAVVAVADSTAWPWLAIVAGAVGVVAGIQIMFSARRWPAATRRYDAVRLDSAEDSAELRAPLDRAQEWDSLSDGDDPTTR